MFSLDHQQTVCESFDCSFAQEVIQSYSVTSVKKSFLSSLQCSVTSPIKQVPKHAGLTVSSLSPSIYVFHLSETNHTFQRDVAWWIKHSPLKYKGQSLGPQNTHKSHADELAARNPSSREA